MAADLAPYVTVFACTAFVATAWKLSFDRLVDRVLTRVDNYLDLKGRGF